MEKGGNMKKRQFIGIVHDKDGHYIGLFDYYDGHCIKVIVSYAKKHRPINVMEHAVSIAEDMQLEGYEYDNDLEEWVQFN